MPKSAFTLVEMMIVIAIIGILSAVLFPSISKYLQNAKITTMKQDVSKTSRAIEMMMNNDGKTLQEITGSNCSECSTCRAGTMLSGRPGYDGNVRTVQAGDICYDTMVAVWQKLRDNSMLSISVPYRDPWGGMYTIDENFGEIPLNPCRKDNIISAGSDGKRDNIGDYTFELDFPTTCP